jgi:hypothetical protein
MTARRARCWKRWRPTGRRAGSSTSVNASSTAPLSPQKKGLGVGTPKRGKGTKLMAVADRAGLPLAVHTASATPHEVTLVPATLAATFTPALPERLIGEKAYDSDPLDSALAKAGVELIAPHQANRRKPATPDGLPLRRDRRRWKIERVFAWLQNFRRLVGVRQNFQASVAPPNTSGKAPQLARRIYACTVRRNPRAITTR